MSWFCDCIQEVLINYAKCAVKMAVAPCLNIKYHINEASLACIEFTAYSTVRQHDFILNVESAISGKLQCFYIYMSVYIFPGGGKRLHTWLAYEEVTEYSHKMVPSAIVLASWIPVVTSKQAYASLQCSHMCLHLLLISLFVTVWECADGAC